MTNAKIHLDNALDTLKQLCKAKDTMPIEEWRIMFDIWEANELSWLRSNPELGREMLKLLEERA